MIPGLNWTKIGLKPFSIEFSYFLLYDSLNWTKIGLKRRIKTAQDSKSHRLNWTKIGLKRMNASTCGFSSGFELD